MNLFICTVNINVIAHYANANQIIDVFKVS